MKNLCSKLSSSYLCCL